MAKNKILFRITLCVLFILILQSCTSSINQNYYQYYIGVIKIKHPILVEFSGDEIAYICPDSALKYCNFPNWINRKDVYPYLLIAENTQQQPTQFRCFQLDNCAFFNHGYYPYYKNQEQLYENVTIYKFYYDVETFDAYMQATESYWYDITDPYFQDVDADNYDYFSYGKKYQMVIRPHYNLFQIMKLKHIYRYYW